MKELNRRENLYGNRKKKDEDEDNNEKRRRQEDDDEDTENQEQQTVSPFALSMPKFDIKLKKEQKEAEEKIRAEREPAYAQMVKIAYETDDIMKKGLITMTDKIINQLVEYKNQKGTFAKDSDGIYIILDGHTIVKNNYPDDSKQSGAGLEFKHGEPLDVIGAERFLQVQGHAFYGSVYANDKTVKCGFLKQEKLHLLPYYDLYQLKEDLEEKYDKDL